MSRREFGRRQQVRLVALNHRDLWSVFNLNGELQGLLA
jgi:hypothetical protein